MSVREVQLVSRKPQMLINREQFAKLEARQVKAVKQAEEELDANIVAYSLAGHQSIGLGFRQLCQTVRSRRLSDYDLSYLLALETSLGPDILLVAYEKPWRRYKPK